MESRDISTGRHETGAEWSPGGGGAASGQASARVSQMGGKLSTTMDKVTTQMKERTNRAIESTSRGVDRMSIYMREKNTQEMVQDLQQVVRRHPGKSLVAGLFLGILVGKMMR